MTNLSPGDQVIYRASDGRKFRGVVADYLPLKSRGEDPLIPIRKRAKIYWMNRRLIRKTPTSPMGGGKN